MHNEDLRTNCSKKEAAGMMGKNKNSSETNLFSDPFKPGLFTIPQLIISFTVAAISLLAVFLFAIVSSVWLQSYFGFTVQGDLKFLIGFILPVIVGSAVFVYVLSWIYRDMVRHDGR